MTNSSDTYKNQSKRKQFDEDFSESSIFDILEHEYQVGDIVWAKFNGLSWWPAFVYGSFADNCKYVKTVSKMGLPPKKKYFIYCFGTQLKCSWIFQANLHRYDGLEEFLNFSDTQAAQATTKRVEEQIRKKFKVQLSKELQPLWKEAIKEADELSNLPVNIRMTTFEKLIYGFLTGNKNSITQQGKKQVVLSENISGNIFDNKEQQSQVIYCISSKLVQASPEPVEKLRQTFSINSRRKETNDIEQMSTTQSKSFLMSSMNENDNDVMIIKLNPPIQSTTVSLTTAICHFLDKGIPSLTIYEEVHLVNELINHPLNSSLTLTDAQLYVEQYVINIALRNFHHQISYVQSEFFYDFLLKYPQIILKHRQWFKDFKQTLMPSNNDKIKLKKWQLATLLHAHMNIEQQFH
ncbi:unnamed protein product [Adineta steineri]|uniref:PWWP domain-containing protein n=1 Tax=Adineta steineri TaxID=433720 RepID=A0A819E1T5_9BILA|nr:unnamed protein product [Adineta steineri]